MTALTPRPGIMKIAPYVPGKDSVEGKETIAKLSSNEGALGPSPKAMAAYAKAAAELHRYPDGNAEKLRTRDRPPLRPRSGAHRLRRGLRRAAQPAGPRLLRAGRRAALQPVRLPDVSDQRAGRRRHAGRGAGEGLRRRRRCAAGEGHETRRAIVCLANPNNPTGSYITKDEVRRLQAGLPKNVLLVIDAAYAEYVSRNDYESGVELVDQAENVVMTRTFSKIYGLGGLRLGWMYGPAGIVDVMSRLRQPFNVNLAAQIAGIAALEDIAHTDASRTNNDIWLPWLSAELAKLGLKPLPSVGNFLMVGFGSKERAAAANDWLMNDGLIPRMIAGYGLPEHLRITIGTETEVKAVRDSLARFVAAK